jgi:predicted restriction endonuclease
MTLRYFIRLFSSKRPESRELRKHLINKYNSDSLGYHCSMCLKQYPLSLLDTSHLKPRYTLQKHEYKSLNNIEFMCKICHNLYDKGNISIDRSHNIIAHSNILQFNHLHVLANVKQTYSKINKYNAEYLLWHFTNIFMKNS